MAQSVPKPFSKRNRPAPESYRYDFPFEVRNRIIHSIRQLEGGYGESFDFSQMLTELENKILAEYGFLCSPSAEMLFHHKDPVIEHFFSCDDEKVLDYIEMCFQVRGNCCQQRGVQVINKIFQDETIGFELTPFVEKEKDEPGSLLGMLKNATVIEYQYPQILIVESKYLNTEAVQPALKLLADKRYTGANKEFLKAHEHYRHGHYPACLNECLKAFESTMKIICHGKKWSYRQEDTASVLIKTCLDKGLVPTFSQQQLTSLRTLLESGIPTIRNKKSGHGQGVQQHDVPPHLAKYSLYLTAATILLFAECAE